MKLPKSEDALVTATVKRDDFLVKLNDTNPGLQVGKVDILDQSASYVFLNGKIITYCEDIACRRRSGLPKEAQGAVSAKKFLAMLKRYPDEDITLEFHKKSIVFSGLSKRTGFHLESKIEIPVALIDTPKTWREINSDFTDAVGMVQDCATSNHTAFTLTCLHITPRFIEAFDNDQACRYRIDTGMERPILVKRDAIKFVTQYDFTEIAETKKWLHFKTPTGMIYSIRRLVKEAADFIDLTPIFKSKGVPMKLPKSLKGVNERANEISSSNKDKNLVDVTLQDGRMQIKAFGDTGFHIESKGVSYKGPPVSFKVSPLLLIKLIDRYTNCEIGDLKMKVTGDSFRYVVSLLRRGS